MRILLPKSAYQVSQSACVPTVSKNFPDGLSLTISLLESKHDERDIWMWFPFYCECGAFPPVTLSGEIPTEKWPPNKCFQSVCDIQEAECWENYVSLRKESHQQIVNFQSFIYQKLSRF